MAQFKITQQFANAIHLKHFEEANEDVQLLDDWYIETFNLHNNETIAIIVHGLTKFTFFIPFAEVKNPTEIPFYFVVLLKEVFTDADLPEYIEQIKEIFESSFTFCKANNEEIIEHINSFIEHTTQYCGTQKKTESLDWNEIAAYINNMPITISESRSKISPAKLMSDFLNIGLLDLHDNLH